MTIRLNDTTKAALDIFAAKWLAKTGKALTNDEAVEKLLEMADPDSLEQSKSAKQDKPKDKE